MIDIKKSSYALDELYVLDTASKWIAKSKDEEHINALANLSNILIEDFKCRFWIIAANEYPTYAATTLKTLFPAIDGHRLVVVSNSYKELFENRSYCTVRGTIYDYGNAVKLKGCCSLRELLLPDEFQFSYTFEEIQLLARMLNERLQNKMYETHREEAIQSALNTLAFQVTSMTSPDLLENEMISSMIGLCNLLESELQKQGVSLQRIRGEDA